MRKADLLQGARLLSTCSLLHHADKSKSATGTNAVVRKVKARCWPDMVNKTLRRRASPPAIGTDNVLRTYHANLGRDRGHGAYFFSVVLADVWAVEDILPASVSPHVTYDSGKREIKLLLKSFRPPEMGEENIRF
jgi:hypothetical protein